MASRGHRRRGAVSLALTLGLTLSVGVGVAPARAADPVAAARAQARAAEADVLALQVRVEAAKVAYQAALDGLSSAVTSQVQAGRIADDATQQLLNASQRQRRHLQELYMSGGDSTLGITLTDGPIAASQSTDYLTRLLASDARSVVSATHEKDRALNVAVSLGPGADDSVATVSTVQQRYEDIQTLLAQAQARVLQLSSTAQHLADIQALIARLSAEKRAADAAAAAAAAAAARRATAGGIPADFLALYKAAAPTCPGLPWVVLAAIGQVESGHGSNPHDSSAGAEGPMQFLPATFAAFAVDGDGDGVANIRDPADAIFTAAAYLCSNHAGRDAAGLRGAIYRYNHANWYVELVLNVAAQLAKRFGEPAPPAYVPVV